MPQTRPFCPGNAGHASPEVFLRFARYPRNHNIIVILSGAAGDVDESRTVSGLQPLNPVVVIARLDRAIQ
jgi:hypothetical protein